MVSASLEDVVRATAIARTLCPNIATPFLDFAKNYTFGQDPLTEAPLTFCDIWQLDADSNVYYSQACWIGLAICLLGMLNCLSASVILIDPSFNEPTFLYHRAINTCDFFYLTFTTVKNVSQITYRVIQYSFDWRQFNRYFGESLDVSLAETVEVLVVWMAVERVGCYFPTVFQRLNRRWVAKTVLTISLVVCVSINIPLAFMHEYQFNNSTMGYEAVSTSFAVSDGAQLFQKLKEASVVFRGVCLTMGMAATITVYVLMGKFKKKLVHRVSQSSATGQKLMADVRNFRMLSILQICEALPLIVSCGYGVCVGYLALFLDDQEFLKVSRSMAVRKIFEFKLVFWLRIAKILLNQVSHSVHFLLYVAFCSRIRRVVARKIKLCRSTAVAHLAIDADSR